MKRIVSIVLILCMLAGATAAWAQESWICKSCGTENSGNFCGECGQKKSTGWICVDCGTENEGKFCTNCGAAKDAPKPEQAAKPLRVISEESEAADPVFTCVPSLQIIRHGMTKAHTQISDGMYYPADYNELDNLYLVLRVTNNTDEMQTAAVVFRIDGEDHSFNPSEIEPNSSVSFRMMDVSETYGEHLIEWTLNGEACASMTFTVMEGHSDFYFWATDQTIRSLSLCAYNTDSSRLVWSGTTSASKSELNAGERMGVHMKLTNDADFTPDPVTVCFIALGEVIGWTDQILEPGAPNTYTYLLPDELTGEANVVMLINGIEVSQRTLQVSP